MKKLVLFFVMVSMIAYGVLGSEQSQSTDEKIVFKIEAGLPDQYFETEALIFFKKHVEEKTNNAFDVQIFPNNQLGIDDKEVIDLIQQGIVQMNPNIFIALNPWVSLSLISLLR